MTQGDLALTGLSQISDPVSAAPTSINSLEKVSTYSKSDSRGRHRNFCFISSYNTKACVTR